MSQQNIFIHLDEPIFLLTTRLLSPPPTYALEKNLQQQYKTPLTEAVKYDTAGQIVSWVGRASLHPTRPRVVVALSKFGYTANLIVNHTKSFTLHLLHTTQSHLVPSFGTTTSRDINKFSSIPHTLSPTLHHPLISGCVAWSECIVESVQEFAERWVVVARMISQGGGGGEVLIMSQVRKDLSREEVARLEEQFGRHVERDVRLIEFEERERKVEDVGSLEGWLS